MSLVANDKVQSNAHGLSALESSNAIADPSNILTAKPLRIIIGYRSFGDQIHD